MPLTAEFHILGQFCLEKFSPGAEHPNLASRAYEMLENALSFRPSCSGRQVQKEILVKIV